MFITKKYLSRRTVLRGIGATVALPLLDAMIPARTALAQTAAAPKPHLGFIYFPHGAVMNQWTPTAEGAGFEFTPILKALEPHRKYVTVVSGLENKPAISNAVHAIMPGTWLSCVHPRETADPYGGVTADQIAAKYIGQDTPLPSLEVATEAGGKGGACDRNYGCSYAGTVAFRTPSTPLPMEANPRALFQRLFGQGDTDAERSTLSKQYASILDVVQAEAGELRSSLGPQDKAMLGDYLDSVRELERRVQKLEAGNATKIELPPAPAGMPEKFDEHLNLMFDLVALSWQANLTRIFSMMMVGEATNMTYNHIGIADAFHPLSHHQNEPAKIERLSKIQIYHTQVFAKFVAKLAAMPNGDGSMLDHSILLYGSNMSNSNLHDNYPLPSALVGGGWGKIKGNQHLKYPDRTPLANLLLTVLDRAGVPEAAIGDSNAKFTEV
jgi:hypothetical protein